MGYLKTGSLERFDYGIDSGYGIYRGQIGRHWAECTLEDEVVTDRGGVTVHPILGDADRIEGVELVLAGEVVARSALLRHHLRWPN